MSEASGVRRVAVVLPDMIGTTVCARPALAAIYAAFPAATVQLLGFAPVSRFLCDEPCGRDLSLLDLPLRSAQLAGQLPQPPDVAFDLLGTDASRDALVSAGSRRLVGWPDRHGQVTDPVPFPSQRHQLAVQDYLDFLVAVGAPAPFSPPRLTAAPATLGRGREWLRQQGVVDDEALVSFGVGGGNDRKRWPLEHFLALEDRFAGRGRPIVFVGPREAELVDRLLAAPGRRVVAASLPLDLAKGILAHGRLAVCNDHAIMHLCAALGVPTIGVFLASDPDEWFPYPPPSRRVIGPPLPCRPCYRADCEGWECNDPSLPGMVAEVLEELWTLPRGERAVGGGSLGCAERGGTGRSPPD
ncbi:MAG: glycosyltransferase family 9 protein [Deltaproteobacteria bacterium]|nr:glycosyltransferase family 9 protein [Deltaproteobacteria bacterium]